MGCPILALFSALTFTNPWGGGTAGVIWAGAVYIIAGMAYTFTNIPYGALAGVMTEDAQQRNRINTSRNIGMNVGMIIVNALSPVLLLKFSGPGAEMAVGRRVYHDCCCIQCDFHSAVSACIFHCEGECASCSQNR